MKETRDGKPGCCFDQVDHYMDDQLLVQDRICSGPTMPVTVTSMTALHKST